MTCHDVSGEKINYFPIKVRGSESKTLDCCSVVAAFEPLCALKCIENGDLTSLYME